MASALVRKLPLYCKYNRIIFQVRCLSDRTEANSVPAGELKNGNEEGFMEVTVNFEDRGKMTFSTGKLAKFADGCATVTFKDTTVMSTVVSKEKKDLVSFAPLTVYYHQKAAALGRIPLNFLRREVGQNEHEILTSRMIDRSIRPLFPEGFNWETQIICNPLAIDGSNFPDVLAINAASAALAVSGVPWDGPVGAVRIGCVDGKPILNPTKAELKESELNIIVAGRESKLVTMLDGTAVNIGHSFLLKSLKYGAKECQRIAAGIATLRNSVGKTRRTFVKAPVDPELQAMVEALSVAKLKNIFQNYSHHKLSRDEEISELQKSVLTVVSEDFGPEKVQMAADFFRKLCKNILKNLILETETRCDGRGLKDLRKIRCEVDLYKPLHGSALFQRGQTQVMCTVALDSPNSALKMDKTFMLTSGLKEKNFFVHYEFPPYATKDTGRLGPIGRREIGHGALAEKALQSNVPEQFPFTIRLTSEVLESNGSSSMATVCGGTLALMDAGVPILSPCAGVAMGFVSNSDKNDEITDYKILTDILGIEDFFGEMDFKIAGTKKAYTAFQMDVKNSGVPLKIIFEILVQAKDAISQILNEMRKTCPEVRSPPKPNSPVMETVKVPSHLRSKFLGPGGLHLRKLENTIGVELWEEVAGEFTVFAPNKDAMKEAQSQIGELLLVDEEFNLEFGAVYKAVITEVKETGCMVTFSPNMKPVHIHVSQLDMRKVNHPSALGLSEGQEIRVKYFGRDPVSGAMRLSRKVLMGPMSEVVQDHHIKSSAPETKNSSQQCEIKEGS